MEISSQKSLEKVLSQRALQMGNSFPCQICVLGFLCGVCLTSLFLAALTSFGSFEFGGFELSTMSLGASPRNSGSEIFNIVTSTDCNFKPKETERLEVGSQSVKERTDDERVPLLYSAWSAKLTKSADEESEYLKQLRLSRSNVPNAPHLENCKLRTQVNEHLDRHPGIESFPPWTGWKQGWLDAFKGLRERLIILF